MAKRILKALVLCFIAASLLVSACFLLLNDFLSPVVEKNIRQFAAKNFDRRVQIAQVRVMLPDAIVHISGFKLAASRLGKSCISVTAGETILHLNLLNTILQKRLVLDEAYLKDWILVLEKPDSTVLISPAVNASAAPNTQDPSKNLFSSACAKIVKVENLRFVFKNQGSIEPSGPIELMGIDGVISGFSASLENPGNFKGKIKLNGSFGSGNKGIFKAIAAVSKDGERLDFTLKSGIKDADLTYFSRYYANTSFTIIDKARIDIDSDVRCNNNELLSSHKARIYDIKLNKITPRPEDTLFALPAVTVINFFNDYGGEVTFGFDINGALSSPVFEPGPLIQKVLSKALGDKIAARLKELPRDVAKISKMAVNGYLDIGKEPQAWFKEMEKRFENFKEELKEKYDAAKGAK